MTNKSKLIGSLLTTTVVVDQVSKLIVDRIMSLHSSIPVIPGLFNLTYIRNTGAAFGIFAGSADSFRVPFLIIFSLLAIAFVIGMLWRLPEDERGLIVGLTLILGGALGNLIDRVLYGEVIDFLDFYWGNFHWPAFNFADSFITVGVALTFYRLVRSQNDPFSRS